MVIKIKLNNQNFLCLVHELKHFRVYRELELIQMTTIKIGAALLLVLVKETLLLVRETLVKLHLKQKELVRHRGLHHKVDGVRRKMLRHKA